MGRSDYAIVQDNVGIVHAWFKEWFMDFNTLNYRFMIISRKHSKCSPPIQLLMDGVGIERVNEYKYFGVWLSDTLGWSDHVNKFVRRAYRQIGMMYRTFF